MDLKVGLRRKHFCVGITRDRHRGKKEPSVLGIVDELAHSVYFELVILDFRTSFQDGFRRLE